MHSGQGIRSYRFTVGASALFAAAVTMVWGAKPAHAQACCNTVSSQTVVPPDAPFTGPVFFNLQSSCTGKACGGSITLSPSTTTQQKCSALVAAINATCSAASFQVLASGNACASTSTFTVTDTACNCGTTGAGKGVTLLLSNSGGTGSFISTGFLPDYEDDIITTCGGANPTGGSLGNLSGSATGTPVAGGTTANVSFDVFTEKSVHVIETVPTTMGEPAAQVVTQAASLLNEGLSASSQAHCNVDTKSPSTLRCAFTGSGSQEQDLALAIQLNDTGFVRLQGAGPSADVAKVQSVIDTNGGIQSVTALNVVAPANPVPASPPWGLAGFALMLTAGGIFIAKRRAGQPS